ncbi:MAG: choice-of-anchor E domain-containing protein [Acidimicrobiia bacterium]|nr:choice-of-anchor E domain-containing protein [Acidimicrobiia bacterium]
MRNRTSRRIAIIATAMMIASVLFGTGAASAAEQTVMDEVPITLTDWSDTLSVPQFDPANGVLQQVDVTFEATVDGEVKYESLDAAPTTISLELKAEIELQRPDTSTLSLLVPLVTQVDDAAAFDGVIDFDGPSGGAFPGLTDTLGDTQVLTTSADLALFSGTGTVDLPVTASGMSSGSGAGNLLLNFQTNAAAKLMVTYRFSAPSIDIEKATNGEDADAPTGPEIPVGDAVAWTYVVTNTGDVTLSDIVVTDDQGVAVSCPQTTLAPLESMTCTGSGTAALGQYANIGSVVGTPVDDGGQPLGPPVDDEDPSHYLGVQPAGGEGCTPGYWKQPQHFGNWVGYSPDDSYADVFGVPYNKTLLEALQTGGGGVRALGRHSVAALLNTANDDVSFAFTASGVIALVQDAWATGDFAGAKSHLAAENEQGCDLGRNPGPDGGSGQGGNRGKRGSGKP